MAIKKGIKLTTGPDSFLEAKDTDDIFIANVLGNSNTFQSGDEIDGGKGIDQLDIVLGNESGFAISAATTGVEKVSVRSQSNNGGDASAEGNSGDNNVSSYESEDGDADENTIDAQDMEGVTQFWNTDSRSDLVIEDVRIGGIADPDTNTKGQIVTENVTIGWKNTDPSSDGDKVDYHVFFSPESLRKTDGTSSMSIEWLDKVSTEKLAELPYNGFNFTMNGKLYTVQDTKDTDPKNTIDGAKTYDQLVKAVQAAVDKIEGLENITVSKSTTMFTEPESGKKGFQVILTANDGASLVEGENLTSTGGTPSVSHYYTNVEYAAVPGFVTSKVVLDNVGRESEAGNLVIGSMSTRSGVEKFKVDVLRTEGKNLDTEGNWVASMSSTNEKLQEVVITKNDGAYLYVGSQDDSKADDDAKVDNNNLTVDREVPTFVNTDGLTDVRVFNASKMTGNVKVGATLANTDGKDSSDTSKKYLLSKMDAATKAYYDEDSDGQVDFNYTTGSGNDTVNLQIEDQCDVTIKTGAGDDNVQLNVGVVTGGIAGNNSIGGQIKINLGSGDNKLTLSNESKLDIASTKKYDESKEDYSNDTIVIDTAFGANTVKNFNATNDKLDFTAYATKAKSEVKVYAYPEETQDDDGDTIPDIYSDASLAKAVLEDVVSDITSDYKAKAAGTYVVFDKDGTTLSATDYNAYSVEVDAKGVAAVTLIGNIDIAQTITTDLLA